MICYIGVGANAGDRLKNIKKAIGYLKKTDGIRVKKISPFYETKPQGGPKGQRNYLNLVLKIESTSAPLDLLTQLKEIERKVGRRFRRPRWAARKIDLDILLYGSNVIREKKLKVPHPLMQRRYFVMRPLFDIAPRLRHPTLKTSVSALLESLNLKRLPVFVRGKDKE